MNKHRQHLTARRRNLHARIQQLGMKPEEVGTIVVQAIKDGRFYILTDPERTKRLVRLRMEGILNWFLEHKHEAVARSASFSSDTR